MVYHIKPFVNVKLKPKGMIWEQPNRSGRPWVVVIEAEGQILGTDSVKTTDFVPPKSWTKLSPLLGFQSKKEIERAMCYSFILPNSSHFPQNFRELQDSGLFSHSLRFSLPICRGLLLSWEATASHQWLPSSPGEMLELDPHVISVPQVGFWNAILAQNPRGGFTSRDIQPKSL